MNDRAYAKVQAQQKTVSGSAPNRSLLQRTCTCGQHTIAGGECSACRGEQSTLLRSQRAFEPPSAPGVVPGSFPVQKHGASFNSSFDRASRLGHNFSQIPVHSSYPPGLQTKLKVNQPGDVYEQEADQVAEQVMRMPNSKSPVSDDEDEAKNSLMRKESNGPGTDVATESPDVPQAVHTVLNSGGGQPLDTTTRAFMEPRFGHDFSGVRVHTDDKAVQSARAVHALAYTVGRDIVFAEGRYTPITFEGRRLLAHELTHTLQQDSATTISPMRISSSLEHEAERVANKAMTPPDLPDASAPTISRLGWLPGEHLQRQVPESTEKTATKPVSTCAKPYTQATTFLQLIDLVRAAETKLSAAGISSTKEQIHALRGIYYGTTWSRDYTGFGNDPGEASITRNEGFQRFTRPSEAPDKSGPPDVRRILDCGLFDALKASQDMIDPSGRQVDFGHLIIGLDARNDPQFASNVSYPVPVLPGMKKNIDLGGTGTELVTWLGDLGGGAASLAIRRATDPGTKVSTSFTGSDYGGSINLEGDVAGFVVATGSPTTPTAPTFAAGKGLSDALQDYLSPSASGGAWKSRATVFLKKNGGLFDAAGTLTNRAALITAFSAKIQTFACNYLASRVKDRHISFTTARAAANHVVPASQEVAETAIDAFNDSTKAGDKIEAKRFPSPKPSQSGACLEQLAAAWLLKGL